MFLIKTNKETSKQKPHIFQFICSKSALSWHYYRLTFLKMFSVKSKAGFHNYWPEGKPVENKTNITQSLNFFLMISKMIQNQ